MLRRSHIFHSKALPVSNDSTDAALSSPVAVGPTGAWAAKSCNWIPDPNDKVAHPNRTVILCFDGTGDQFDGDNSNIVQFMAMLKKDDPERQMVYYQAGIGTYGSNPGGTIRAISKVLDVTIAVSLDDHVRSGYEFLMQTYRAGDKICIFGFSRGAYTARALAGMLQKVGLLPQWNKQQLPFAYKFYAREDAETLELSREFKHTFSIDVKIEFVGVWDTVASVGIVPRYLPFVTTNNAIRYFRHALALDEHRIKFAPSFYHQSCDHPNEPVHHAELDTHSHGKESTAGTLVQGDDPDTDDEHAHIRMHSHILPEPEHKKDISKSFLYEYKINRKNGQTTDALEVWFAGAHADVGGGSVANHTRHSLARIPLRWMIRECFRAKTGIVFDLNMLRNDAGLDVDDKALRIFEPPARLSGKGSHLVSKKAAEAAEAERRASMKVSLRASDKAAGKTWPPFESEALEELKDALQPIYDQLEDARAWWLLEWLPVRLKKDQAIFGLTDRRSDYAFIVNRGKGRKVYKQICSRGINVHRSVLTRLEAAAANEKSGEYYPLVRPHVVKVKETDQLVRHCKRIPKEHWLSNSLPDSGGSWFQWVGDEAPTETVKEG